MCLTYCSKVGLRADYHYAHVCFTAKRDVVRRRRSCCAGRTRLALQHFPRVQLAVEVVLKLCQTIEVYLADLTEVNGAHGSPSTSKVETRSREMLPVAEGQPNRETKGCGIFCYRICWDIDNNLLICVSCASLLSDPCAKGREPLIRLRSWNSP